MSFLHPFQGPLRLAPQSFTYNLKLRDWRRIEVENFDAFIYFTWFLDFSLFPSFYKFPNIQGDFGWSTHGLFTVATGVFKGISRSSDYFASASPDGTADYARVELDSSIGSSVFGNSSSVQPSALRVLTLIRSY